jgi:hypothetical protein
MTTETARKNVQEAVAGAVAVIPGGQANKPRRSAGIEQLRVVGSDELLAMKIPPREELLGPWLTSQNLSMIHAWRGIGKTHVAVGVAVAVATGTSLFRWRAPKPKRVLYVDGELPLVMLQERVKAAIERCGVNPAPGYLQFITPDALGRSAPDLADLTDQALLDAAIGDADLVILDNLSCLIRSGAAENDAESWVQVSDWALRHRARGRSIVFIHHSGKAGAQRGTSRREDLLDVVISLRKPQEADAKDGARFEVHFEKGRHLTGEDLDPFEVALVDGGWTVSTVDANTDQKIVERLGLGLSLSDIARELGVHKSTVSRRVQDLRACNALPPEGEKVRNTSRNRGQKRLPIGP